MPSRFPSFYKPANASNFKYDPDARKIFLASSQYRFTHGIFKSFADDKTIALLLIDMQRDFCFPKGSLYVAGRSGTGAIDDSARIAEFVYREMKRVTSITATFDTHSPLQIFFPYFLVDQHGNHLLPYDIVDGDLNVIRAGVQSGLRASVNPAIMEAVVIDRRVSQSWLRRQLAFYCATLAKANKPLLCVWPEHCLVGTTGHALAGVVMEAILFHSYVRSTEFIPVHKGNDLISESYSVFSPEVVRSHDIHDRDVVSEGQEWLYADLLDHDVIITAGQAGSHCVRSSLDDLLVFILKHCPQRVKDVYVLRDCMSAVVVPGGPDYTDEMEASFARYQNAGMNVVRSTDPMESWLRM